MVYCQCDVLNGFIGCLGYINNFCGCMPDLNFQRLFTVKSLRVNGKSNESLNELINNDE